MDWSFNKIMHGIKRIFSHIEPDEVIELDETLSHRLKIVMRAQVGDNIEILTPTQLAMGRIGVISKRSVTIKIDTSRAIIKPNYSLTVYQCIAKREYMDFITEKYAELGVTSLVPVISARSLPTLKQNTLERLKTIAVEAAIQSEKEFVMEITPSLSIERIKINNGINILFHERSGQRNIPIIKCNNVQMVIGPEGGFTDKETQHLTEKGFIPVTPIKSILKAETAAVLFTGIVALELNN